MMLTDLLKLQLDLLGARSELAMTVLGGRLLKRIAPCTDGAKPVITIPGFLASQASLVRMNRFLNEQGFTARYWGRGRNLGPRSMDWNRHLDLVESHLEMQVKALADETSQPVSLVGQSLGGVYARELAMRLESEVDRVIMLGSPTFHPYRADRHNRVVGSFSYWVNRRRVTTFAGREGLLHWEPDRPALPCVAIHSPLDGVVDERACHIPGYIVRQCGRNAPRENVRVLSSHVGMSVSPVVWLALADRLLADPSDWRPFDPLDYFSGHLEHAGRLLYPDGEALWEDGGPAAFVEMNR